MKEFYILNKDSVNKCDPHGYFNDVGRRENNFKSFAKRSFLNECIQQIYIINDMPIATINPAEFNKAYLWNVLNILMAPDQLTTYQASIERVKRRLFRESKQRQRKFRKPKFNDSQISECFYFKKVRQHVGVRKIQRNYLEQARISVYNDIRQNLKRKHIDEDDESEAEENDVHFKTNEEAFEVSQQVTNKVCLYRFNMARNHPQCECSMEEQLKWERNTEACSLGRRAKKFKEMLVEQQYRERLKATEHVLEASIRSILYMKALMGLMDDQQDNHNLYI